MRTRVFSSVFMCFLILGLAIPSTVLGSDPGKGCTLQGTWFGVISPEEKILTGWMATVAGKSSNQGTNNLEYPNTNPAVGGFDITLGNSFPTAAHLSSVRGAWERISGNKFAYTITGFAVDSIGTPVWIGRLSGTLTLSGDCNSESITAMLDVFDPTVSPFDGDPLFSIVFPEHYGYRAYVAMP